MPRQLACLANPSHTPRTFSVGDLLSLTLYLCIPSKEDVVDIYLADGNSSVIRVAVVHAFIALGALPSTFKDLIQ